MQIFKFEQKSDEWKKIRLGLPTSSNFDKIVTSKGEPSKQKQKYIYQLAGERVSGVAEESYQSQAMLRGVETEEEARRFYEFTTGEIVKKVGFCLSDCGRYGASPDGLVGEDGLVEIKCPTLAVHVGYLLDNKLPTDYFQQTQGQLFVTGRKWSDFISYFPGIKPLLIRVERNEEFIKCLESELKTFCDELEIVIGKIK